MKNGGAERGSWCEREYHEEAIEEPAKVGLTYGTNGSGTNGSGKNGSGTNGSGTVDEEWRAEGDEEDRD